MERESSVSSERVRFLGNISSCCVGVVRKRKTKELIVETTANIEKNVLNSIFMVMKAPSKFPTMFEAKANDQKILL